MCGVGAAYLFDHRKQVSHLLYQMLLSQENRMNYSAGITVFNEKRENDYLIAGDWGLGPINTAFGLAEERTRRLNLLEGYAGIAHGRYATSNSNKPFSTRQKTRMAPPYCHYSDKRALHFSFGFNGNIANFKELYNQLKGEEEGYYIRTETDTEVFRILLLKGITKALRSNGGKELKAEAFKDIFAELDEKIIGAYSLVFQDGNGNLILARDAEETRPLVYTVQDFGFLGASEPTAFHDQNIYTNIMNVEGGHFIIMNRKHEISDQIQFAQKRLARCTFDQIYFSHVTSCYDQTPTQLFRRAIGARMAEEDSAIQFTSNDLIACVPETAREYVNGYIEGFIRNGRLPPVPLEALIRNKNFRNFMEDDPQNRINQVRHKFRSSRGIAQGKRLFLGDDSTVRGDVMRTLIPVIKEELQPAEIHLRIFYDQFQHPCYRGIDVPEPGQLLSARLGGDVERIRRNLGVDSLKYTSITKITEVLAEMSGKSPSDYCTGCADGGYPTEFEKKLAGV